MTFNDCLLCEEAQTAPLRHSVASRIQWGKSDLKKTYTNVHMPLLEMLYSCKNSLLTTILCELSTRLASFTWPPQTVMENHIIFPGGKTADVNYPNGPAINPCTGVLLVSLPCVSSQSIVRRSYRIIDSI